jgi:ParB/RepB/Spo0J family partition protein
METTRVVGRLSQVAVRRIQPNPDNPRVAFRQGELEELQESIRQYGVQVPVAVFKRGSGFVLIDGERRWRCASKLNLKTIPALIQKEPGPLQNLLLMFNIHALREQWDLLTIALKLPQISQLLKAAIGRVPTEAELSTRTGLSRSVIRRSRLLMDLPKHYRDMLLVEIKKPKAKQTLSEDFFIEMEKALKSVAKIMPDVITDVEGARQVLLRKYKNNVIDNIVDFRKLPKIARAEKVHANPVAARDAIRRVLEDPKYSINAAWNETVSEAYAERDILSRIEGLLLKLDDTQLADIDDDIREKLEQLIERARALLDASP